MNRREFIATSALATAGTFWLSSCMSKSTGTFGIQLYTVKDIIASDVMGTLDALAAMGYTDLETWGYNAGAIFNMPYTRFASEVQKRGMKLISGHFETGVSNPDQQGTLINRFETVIEDVNKSDQQYIVIGGVSDAERDTLDHLRQTCELLNRSGETCKKHGVRLGFHNHASEFQKIGDEVIYDIMLRELDPQLVTMELDLYWMVFGGYDPLTYIKKYPARFELWHVKDMDKMDRTRNSDVGSGSLDFKAIFGQTSQAGLKHFFVEQEYFTGSPLESVKNGLTYLKSIHADR